MSWDSFADGILSIPPWAQWALGIAGAAIGLFMILAPQRITRGLRKWLLFQLRLVRRPGYRRMLKIYGWLLFVFGALLMLLLVVMRGQPMQ